MTYRLVMAGSNSDDASLWPQGFASLSARNFGFTEFTLNPLEIATVAFGNFAMTRGEGFAMTKGGALKALSLRKRMAQDEWPILIRLTHDNKPCRHDRIA